MIVPFAPGGASDVVARIIGPGLVRELGQQVVVDNRGGASGNIGVEAAARAAADGYTVLLGNIGTMAINTALFPKFPVSPVRDLIAVTLVVDASGDGATTRIRGLPAGRRPGKTHTAPLVKARI